MEKDTEKYLNDEVKKLGGLCVKFPPLFFRGFPDRIVLLSGAVIVFVELKDAGRKPSKIQERVHAKLRGLGFRVEVLDGKDEVKGFMSTL